MGDTFLPEHVDRRSAKSEEPIGWALGCTYDVRRDKDVVALYYGNRDVESARRAVNVLKDNYRLLTETELAKDLNQRYQSANVGTDPLVRWFITGHLLDPAVENTPDQIAAYQEHVKSHFQHGSDGKIHIVKNGE